MATLSLSKENEQATKQKNLTAKQQKKPQKTKPPNSFRMKTKVNGLINIYEMYRLLKILVYFLILSLKLGYAGDSAHKRFF